MGTETSKNSGAARDGCVPVSSREPEASQVENAASRPRSAARRSVGSRGPPVTAEGPGAHCRPREGHTQLQG